MFTGKQIVLAALGVLCIGSTTAYAQEPPVLTDDLQLSQELRGMLQAEMREIAVAVQTLALFLATADWESIENVSEKIRASYVMEKSLSASQRQELKDRLPEAFKRLDMNFHARAEKLGMAAAARDAEIAAYQYHRLIESCTVCHAMFAKTRFPGFSSISAKEHQH